VSDIAIDWTQVADTIHERGWRSTVDHQPRPTRRRAVRVHRPRNLRVGRRGATDRPARLACRRREGRQVIAYHEGRFVSPIGLVVTCPRCGGTLTHQHARVHHASEAVAVTDCEPCKRTWMLAIQLREIPDPDRRDRHRTRRLVAV
jgi:hypothetical protein